MGQLAQSMTWEGAEASRDEAVPTRQEQFAALVHRQSSLVFRIAFAVLRNTHDAEDAVQETFLKVYRQGKFEQIEDERAYLARVAWRIAATRRSRQSSSTEMPEQVSAEPNPEQASAFADWDAHVRLLIDSLPAELRDPLLLRQSKNLVRMRSQRHWAFRKVLCEIDCSGRGRWSNRRWLR